MTTIRTRLAVLATTGALGTAGLTVNAATATATGVPRCGNAALAVTRTFVDSGAGHSGMTLVYRNAGRSTCTVSGYPGLDALSASGRLLAHADRVRGGYGGDSKPGTVTVRPGGYASAGVEWLTFNPHTGATCSHAGAVTTIVANTTRAHRLPVPVSVSVSVSVCGLQVHPTVGGTPGYPRFGPAQRDWIAGSTVDAATINTYLTKAEHELAAATVFPSQVRQLAQLISIPETSLTPTQLKQARADVAALDRFFATPGLYS